jgi:cytoskeletal protein CcmA (bactofilin family)
MNIRSSVTALALGGTLLLLALPSAAMASEVRSGTAASVAPDETLDDDLFASGQTVTIAGRATGDVYATGQAVVVTGTVDGDLFAAAQQVVVDGTVNGSVRAAGGTVTVNGHVGRNVSGVAQQVNISSSGRIDGSLLAAGETISAFGPVGRGATVGGGTVQLSGPVGGSVKTWAQTLSLGSNARIAGNLEYYSEHPIDTSGMVAGLVQYHQIEREQRQPPVLNGLFDFGGLIWLIGSALLGALAIILAPRASARAVELGRQEPLQTFGLGLLALCAVPLAAILVGITLVGIPLALVAAALYGLGLMLAWPALGLTVGTEVSHWVRRDREMAVLGQLVVGLIVLHLATHVPVLGGLVASLGLMFGLGLIVQSFRRWRRPLEPARAAVPVAVPA